MKQKNGVLLLCVFTSLGLCAAQIAGTKELILVFLLAFMALLGWNCIKNFTLPVLLFFLPWAPLLKMAPGGYSFFTFGLIMVCLLSIIKKRFALKKYNLMAGIFILILTLFSKLLDSVSLTMYYFAFIIMLVLFPVVKEEYEKKQYDFFLVVLMFSLGAIIAALCALLFASYPNISRYINVASYSTIVRRCGFYNDANFYTAQITAALGGVMHLTLKNLKKQQIAMLMVLAIVLLYCGFLSGSKSFVLVSSCVLLLWLVAFLRIRGRVGFKIVMLITVVLAAIYIASSVLFGDLIDIVAARFARTTDLESFTTGRIKLWKWHIEEIITNPKVFFLGKGFTDVKVNGRASHSTVLQAFFQFGIVGVPLLVFWIASFFKDNIPRRRKYDKLGMWIVAVGVVMPWLAIDGLLADEFFLLQWYLFVAIQNMKNQQNVATDIIRSYGNSVSDTVYRQSSGFHGG